MYSFSSGGAVYRFSRCIGRGGMGEVHLGMQEGIGGLERLVVIKRIYPHFGEDEHFTRMLLDEARLAASIRHPNVVQILDIGKDASGYFIVMEYLSGETLIYIKRSLRALERGVPPSIACRIAAEVAAGLQCAHTATDPAGNPQPIVHRDVTPSNLIVCFNGVVKIVDFGVAKATLHEGHTRGGVKGKMSYLAPEQLQDRPVDGRTDIFQLGICLHELLTGQRLFRGDNDHQRAVAVMQQEIARPSSLNPALPKVLDEVVLWALERDPERRPESADEFRRALEAAAAEIGTVSGHDLGGWMKTEFADRLIERTTFERQCVAEMREGRSSTAEIPLTSPIAAPTGAGLSGRDSMAGVRPLPLRLASLSPPPLGEDSMAHPHPPRRTGSGSVPPRPGRRWTVLGLIGVGVVMATAIAIIWKLGGSSNGSGGLAREGQGSLASPEPVAPKPAPPMPAAQPTPPPAEKAIPPRQYEVAVTVVPSQAIIEIDGVEVGRGSYRADLPMDGVRHIMTVRAEGYEAVGLDFADTSPPSQVVLEPVRPRPPPTTENRPPVAAARQVKRAAPAPARRAATTRPRPELDIESFLTDNPDPWAETQGGDGEGDRSPEVSQ